MACSARLVSELRCDDGATLFLPAAALRFRHAAAETALRIHQTGRSIFASYSSRRWDALWFGLARVWGISRRPPRARRHGHARSPVRPPLRRYRRVFAVGEVSRTMSRRPVAAGGTPRRANLCMMCVWGSSGDVHLAYFISAGFSYSCFYVELISCVLGQWFPNDGP